MATPCSSHGFGVGHQFVRQIADPFEASGFDENPVMRNDVRIREDQFDILTGTNRRISNSRWNVVKGVLLNVSGNDDQARQTARPFG